MNVRSPSAVRVREFPGRNCLSLAAALASLVALACNTDSTFERMIEQPRFDTYEPSPYFENGTIMQHPPFGTVHRTELIAPVPLEAPMPFDLNPTLLTRGKDRFEIFCAVCHGILGDGESRVARNMALRPPPSLLAQPILNYSPARLYTITTEGYGLMPSYQRDLSYQDRWAVAAYVKVLQFSQTQSLAGLPPAFRDKASEALDTATRPGVAP